MPIPRLRILLAALGLVALVVAAVVVPAAAFDAPVLAPGVQVPPQREGDALRYAATWSVDGEAFVAEILLRVGAAAEATDAYGLPREVDVVDVAIRGPDDDADYRCAFLAGGADLVRRDLVAGTDVVMISGTSESLPFTEQPSRQSTQTLERVSAFGAHCPGRHTLGGATLRAGDGLALADALGGLLSISAAPTASAVAEAATWEGRDAVRLAYAFDEARVVTTWADGVPGVAQVEVTGATARLATLWMTSTQESPLTLRLIGLERGEGRVVGGSDAALPATHPSARFVGTPALTVDDVAFSPAYPYADAIAALRADPLTCARQLLARPDVVVWRAEWDADARDYVAPDAPTLGGWYVRLVAGDTACSAFTTRLAPDARLPPITRSYDEEGPVPSTLPANEAPVLPPRVVDAAALAELSRLGGVEPRGARNVVWTLAERDGAPVLHLRIAETSPNPREGAGDTSQAVDVLASSGALEDVMVARTQVTASTLPGGIALAIPPARGAALGSLAWPGVGEGLAIAGAAAALGVLLKALVVPLYTRLRRATLLDNTVRARLYDAIRADPGIHKAALVEFAGVGAGATTRHLRQLVAHGFAVELREGAFARYYAAGEVPAAVARREASLRAGSRREVYEIYRAQPDLTLREAARRLGMSAPSVYRAKQRLEKEGLLPARPEAVVAQR